MNKNKLLVPALLTIAHRLRRVHRSVACPDWIRPLAARLDQRIITFLSPVGGQYHGDGRQWWLYRDGIERPGF